MRYFEALNTADICVNPDEVNAMNDKSTMNKIMEYMALGKPIVQFEVTEGRVSAGGASLYAKANDAVDLAENIVSLLDNPSQREKMGEIGRARVENELSWPHEAPKLLAAYNAVFNESASTLPSQLMEKTIWYKNRLQAMSLAEILHRVLETGKRHIDRYCAFDATEHATITASLPVIPNLREQVMLLPTSLLNNWKDYAYAIRNQRFSFLGQQWPEHHPPLKWHLDPVTGNYWPKDRYCFAVDFRHTRDMGDVKYVWELNRLQYLQPLAALAIARGDKGLALFCLEEIESWIDANPPYMGVNWGSGIELAFRTVSILIVVSLLGEYMSEAQQQKFWQTMQAHGYWIARYPSSYSSANNHRTAEALGLFAIGTLCPALPNAAEWKKTGWDILCESTRLLILEDGVGAEQSISYTANVVEMLLLGLFIARTTNVEVPSYYEQKLATAGDCLRWFLDSANHHPRIGDDDDARVLGIRTPDEHYAASILCNIASFLHRPDLAPHLEEAHLRQAFFGAPLTPSVPPNGVRMFDVGGYTVGHHSIKEHDVMIALDHGYLGYLSIAAHGHADALSVWMHVDGMPVFVDAGVYLYHGDGEWRSYFRSTRAHNTLLLENTDSSLMAGNFNWSHKANVRATAHGENTDGWWVEAEHDGYEARFGVKHCRRLSMHREGYTIEDHLSGAGEHAVEIGFLLHPYIDASIQDENIILSHAGRQILRIAYSGPLSLMLAEADSEKGGWYSAGFGEKVPTARILMTGTLRPDEKSITQINFC
ncbi:MAG: heparinase II/III family protein [Rickettsiales bacterium]